VLDDLIDVVVDDDNMNDMAAVHDVVVVVVVVASTVVDQHHDDDDVGVQDRLMTLAWYRLNVVHYHVEIPYVDKLKPGNE
jgi:hypothetical protein